MREQSGHGQGGALRTHYRSVRGSIFLEGRTIKHLRIGRQPCQRRKTQGCRCHGRCPYPRIRYQYIGSQAHLAQARGLYEGVGKGGPHTCFLVPGLVGWTGAYGTQRPNGWEFERSFNYTSIMNVFSNAQRVDAQHSIFNLATRDQFNHSFDSDYFLVLVWCITI